MNTKSDQLGLRYWLGWFLASTMGYGVGMILGLFVAYGFFDRDVFDATIGITLGIVSGAAGGLMQWLVLRERVAQSGFWVLATALGLGTALGVASSAGEDYLMAGILFAGTFGIVGGILQWLILKRAGIARAGSWVAANLLGVLSGIAGFPIATAIGTAGDYIGNYILSALVFGLLFGAGIGAITGGVLIRLLRQPHAGDVQGLPAAG